MSESHNKRLREGALSALRTPENPPAPVRLTPVRPVRETAEAGVEPEASLNSVLAQEAIRRAKEGDKDGEHFLLVRYSDQVARYVGSFVRDAREAEDITKGVFADLMTTIKRYEQHREPFEAWILRIARNAALDRLRARRAIPSEEVPVADQGRAQTGIDRGRALREALEALPEDQREVLVLRHIVGLSPVEIAGTLEKSESSVHGLQDRAQRALFLQLSEFQEAVEDMSRE